MTNKKTTKKSVPVFSVESNQGFNKSTPGAVAGGILRLEGDLYEIDSVLENGLMLRRPGTVISGIYMNYIFERPGRQFQFYAPVQ